MIFKEKSPMSIGVLAICRGVGGLTCEFWVVLEKNSCKPLIIIGLHGVALLCCPRIPTRAATLIDMASLDSVRQKLYRARHHYLELNDELLSYYRENPVELRVSGNLLGIEGKGAVPARFGLIAGDALQCMRSSLDYLVWELVLASGAQPTSQNAFPISLTVKEYKNQIDNRKRLTGIDPSACALIDTLQPLNLPEAEREGSPLAVLEFLTTPINIGVCF